MKKIKNRKIELVLIIMAFLVPVTFYAQQVPYFSLSQYQLNIINPAHVGSQGSVFTLGTRSQWSAIEGAPQTFTASFATARTEKVGLGFSVVSDKVNVEQQTLAYVDFSYRLTLSEKTQLFLGIKGGGNFLSTDPTGLENYLSQQDPAKVAMRAFNPNIGVGAYLQSGNLWVSLSAPRLFAVNRAEAQEMYAKDRVHSYLAAGTSIEVNEQFDLLPSVLFRKVMGHPLSSEFTAQLQYIKRFQIGAQVRDISKMSLFAFVNINPNIDLGYAYESYLDTQLSGMEVTGHELVLRFRLKSKPKPATEGDESPSLTEDTNQ